MSSVSPLPLCYICILLYLSLIRNINSILFLTVQSYRILWTGLGAQLARDVPFSAICWSTLEPVRYHLFQTLQWVHYGFLFLLLLHVNPTRWHFLLLLCGDPEKNSWTGGWSSQCSQHPRGKLFRWFCRRNSCSCCYVSTWCGKNPAADRGFSPNLASFTCIYLYRVKPLHFTPPPSPFPLPPFMLLSLFLSFDNVKRN